MNCSYVCDDQGLKRRIYNLINDPKYFLVHYLTEIENNLLDETILLNKKRKSVSEVKITNPLIEKHTETTNETNIILNNSFMLNSKPIKIIDFCPESIIEESSGRIFLIIETYLTYKNLKMFENELRIKFGEVLCSCQIVNSSCISCISIILFINSIVPYSKEKEVLIKILLGSDEISYSANEKLFKFTKLNYNNNINKTQTKQKHESLIFQLTNDQLQTSLENLLEEIISVVNFYVVDSSEQCLNYKNNHPLEESFRKLISSIMEKINKNEITNKNLLNKQDKNGYNLTHYLCALDAEDALEAMSLYNVNFYEKSKDELTTYEICAGQWAYNSLKKLINLIDNKDHEEIFSISILDHNGIFYNIDILKSALNIALETGKYLENKDIKVLDILLKQIRIQFTVDSSIFYNINLVSGSIINAINDNMSSLEMQSFSNGIDSNAKCIQRYIRGWLRRSEYIDIKKAAQTLQKSILKLFIYF